MMRLLDKEEWKSRWQAWKLRQLLAWKSRWQNLLDQVSWDRLHLFAQSQLVSIGVVAVTLVPIAAQLIVFWYSLYPPTGNNNAKVDAIRFLATDLYVGGLAMLLGKLFVSLACPERIRRFPFREDFLIYSADSRQAQSSLGDRQLTIEAKVLRRAVNSDTHLATWNLSNHSMAGLRAAIAMLFATGTLCVGSFLVYRLFHNTEQTIGMWGIRVLEFFPCL